MSFMGDRRKAANAFRKAANLVEDAPRPTSKVNATSVLDHLLLALKAETEANNAMERMKETVETVIEKVEES